MAKKSTKTNKPVKNVEFPVSAYVTPRPQMTVSDGYIPKNLKEPKLGQKVKFVVTAEVRRAEQYKDWSDGRDRKDVSLDIHSIKPLKPATKPKGGKK